MTSEIVAPKTLLEAVTYFANADVAHKFVADLRWPSGPVCPQCEATTVTFLATRRIYKCRACKKQFSVKVGTIFEDSPISLSKWMPAMWMIVNCKNGISSYELARAIKVTQKTAWFMRHRIRLAMQSKSFTKIGGEVEVDETLIGGKARNMHAAKRARVITGSGMSGKVAVMGLLARNNTQKGHSTVRTTVVGNTRRETLQSQVRANVRRGIVINSDALASYNGLAPEFIHNVVDHAVCYVKGTVHTNGLENFWSLLKRSIKGTYVSVEPFHLFRYLDEQSFRFNNRKDNDSQRFVQAAKAIAGRRLTYNALTGVQDEKTR